MATTGVHALEGRWRVTRCIDGGLDVTSLWLKEGPYEWMLHGDILFAQGSGIQVQLRLTTNDLVDPKQYDGYYEGEDPDLRERLTHARGIYRIERNTLTRCSVVHDHEPRPTRFESGVGSGVVYVEMERL